MRRPTNQTVQVKPGTPHLTPTGIPAAIDAEYVGDVTRAAQAHGLSFTVESAEGGTAYRLHGVLGELIAWTYDLDELNTAMLNYWPASAVVGTADAGLLDTDMAKVTVDLSPAYAGEPASVLLRTRTDLLPPMTFAQARALGELLIAATEHGLIA